MFLDIPCAISTGNVQNHQTTSYDSNGEHPVDHNHQDFPKSTAVRVGGVLTVRPFPQSVSTESTAIQIGGVLQYKLEVYIAILF